MRHSATRPLQLLVSIVALAASASASQAPLQLGEPLPEKVQDLYEAGKDAISRKDWKRALTAFSLAARKVPKDPRVPYVIARVHAFGNKGKEAARSLEESLALGGGLRAGGDEAFATMRTGATYLALFGRIAALVAPIVKSEVAFTIPDVGLIPEGIAHDPVSGSLYVSSLHERKVVRIARDGTFSDFVTEAQDGLWKAVGLKVDAERRRLWVMSGVDDPGMKGFEPGDLGKGGAFVFDLGSGKLVKSLVPPDGTGKHFFNDAALSRSGAAFVTDSESGAVYKADASAGTLLLLVPPGTFVYPNGIALSDDERDLFVAHWGGVAVLDPATGKSRDLAPCKGHALVGLDGLLWYRGSLVGIQNGLFPDKVVRYRLSPDRDRVLAAEVLEQGHPAHQIPTTGTIAGNALVYVANSQLDAVAPDGTLAREALAPVKLLRLPLGTE